MLPRVIKCSTAAAIRARISAQRATTELLTTGPQSLTLTTGPSDDNGVAEASWITKAPGGKNPRTYPKTPILNLKVILNEVKNLILSRILTKRDSSLALRMTEEEILG
jgi:hypothetical protein